MSSSSESARLHADGHEPGSATPVAPATVLVFTPDGAHQALHPSHFAYFPYAEVEGHFIASTGHDASGPYTFGGLPLAALVFRLARHMDWAGAWTHVVVIGADGFRNRVTREELGEDGRPGGRPILLATFVDGAPLTRERGLVRLIVPGERDKALRQVKWVRRVEIHVAK